MTYQSALSNPLLSRIGVSLIGQGLGLEQRIFITADSVLQTHYTMENVKTFANNFRVSAFCILPTTATTVTLFGQIASASNYFKILSTGFASVSIGGAVVTSTVAATKDSKIRIYGVELSGNDFLFQENGITIDTVTDATAAANSLVLDVCCQSNGADFFNGVYADPKATDLVTSSNSELWELDQPFPITTEQSSSGNNLLTYVNAAESTRELFTLIGGDWFGTELGGVTTVSLTSFSTQLLAGSLDVGSTYPVTVTADAAMTGTVGFIFNGAHDGSKDLTGGQSKSFTYTATTDSFNAQGRPDCAGDVTLSIKRILEVAP